ncbi:MAG TPA: 2Fe-2S iron-sulfur cluster binding domain-containing protein [Acetobacteraceae bacterium]|jgi:CDP-4-dehydro-6-deoxyglucose reductase|nr:2Fe-2S iron-sulfur cluster binding domain-containing protein [Acetobacteraceae bacterium]
MTENSTVRIDGTDAEFHCRDETILDAALGAGLALPHNCRGGACGTCKVEVLEGEVDHGWDMGFAISDAEKAAGRCLICMSRPRSSRLVLRLLGAPPVRPGVSSTPAEYEVKVVAAHDLAPDLRELVLYVPDKTGFRFAPGQHVELIVPGLQLSRPYSIAQAPASDGSAVAGLIRLFVTRHPHGASSGWIHAHARTGRRVTLRGPYGQFAPLDATRSLLMFAGGSGLAPLLAVAEARVGAGDGLVELWLSVRTKADVFALDRLGALAAGSPDFVFRVFVTRPAADALPEGWMGERIPTHLGRTRPDLSGTSVMIAGSPGFVAACRSAVVACGASEGRVVVEAYESRPAVSVGAV